ncbi:MAG: hypothetical protein SO314_00965, partial [Alphaproteobacteria bacterium]|nr:hypothetical protein [Alphaproteobacteria bacterium]
PVPKTDVKTKPVITPFHAILARDIILAAEHGSIAPAEPVPTAQKDVPIIAKTTIFRTLVLPLLIAMAFIVMDIVLVLVMNQATAAEIMEEAPAAEILEEAPVAEVQEEEAVLSAPTEAVRPSPTPILVSVSNKGILVVSVQQLRTLLLV